VTGDIISWANQDGSLNVAEGAEVLRAGRIVTVASIESRSGPRGFGYVKVRYADCGSTWEHAAYELVAVRRPDPGEPADA